jgi:pyruvate dehydrogenase E2 component (dihydrolipoamide acetyltransferase)
MAQLFPMPQLGSTMEEGTILKWLKREGDSIRKGDTLLEIETDKATMEVESPIDGMVLKLLFDDDAVVAVQRPIAVLGSAGETIEHLFGMQSSSDASVNKTMIPIDSGLLQGVQADPGIAHSTVTTERVFISPRARRLAEERGISVSLLSGRGTGPEGRVVERDVAAFSVLLPEAVTEGKARRATPLAARLADDLGIDLNELAFGLPGSRVRRDDILRHASAVPIAEPADALQGDSPAASGSGDSQYTVRPFAGMRKRIADNVSKSRFTAPHVTLAIEVDMTECADLRTRIIPEIEKAFGTRVSYTDILVKAVARALSEHPSMNSALVGDELRVYANQNIGVAVALEEGLIVPVVQNAGSKSLGAISAELKPLIDRARSGKFTLDDISGGTFTITNLGSYGIDQFDPIIVPPQAAILGVCRIAEKAVVVTKQVAIRSIMNLCLSFDHRIVDGAPAAAFLQRLKHLLENPVSILI